MYGVKCKSYENDIIGIWDAAGGDKDGATGEEVAIAAGAIQNSCCRNRTASADVGSGAADI